MFDGSVHDIRRSDIIAVWIGVATLRGSRVNLPGRSIRVINLPHELFLPAWSACPVTAALDEAFHVGGE